MIENPDIVSKSYNEIFEILRDFLKAEGHNILNHYVSEDEVRIYVQTESGLEELVVNENLFTNPLYEEALYISQKIKERGLDLHSDVIDVLDEVEKNAKKGAYIQRYKGLGEMNPEQLWETTMNLNDAISASDTFNLFMGDEVEPRRNYIQDHAKDVKHLDI